MSMNYSTTSQSITSVNYSQYQTNTQPVINVSTSAQQLKRTIKPADIPNSTISGPLPYKQAATGNNIIKKFGRKAVNGIKRVRMAHIFTLTMFGMMCFARFGTMPTNAQGASGNKQAAQQWAYSLGAQYVRDSVRIAELEKQNKLLADSLKLLKKAPK